ncbi:MFS general substrate transporter [Wolfiporia cocos MD-104 SS10]|uniref:MFS general substrate transporter n=1 Tax=Wolfiporia cocos (strain MD-104) TaxID=742152 RepID=A0A2H3JLI8_WOLCO|nr:MFS general substrate transporter [Wolfiporia cocos MD-104 SS10]
MVRHPRVPVRPLWHQQQRLAGMIEMSDLPASGSPSTAAPSAPTAKKALNDVEEYRIDGVVENAEGTHFQSQAQTSARRRNFFAPLDTTYAEAVHNDAACVQYTAEEERKLRRKIDARVLTLVIGSYLFNQFDRTNIGNVHVIPAFNENFGVTNNNKWTLALSVFYVGYCILEMPANVLQRRIGANRFFFMSLTFWGLSSLSFVYAKGYIGLLVLRVLLGIGEAGYYAGMVYYLSFWYKRNEMAMRISICMTGTYPGAISSLIAFGLVRVHTSVLNGWQFLFLIEAIPTIIMAFLLLLFLPSFPFAAGFLSPREKAIAQARMDRDQKPTSHGGMTGWQGFKAVVNDINSWLLVVIYSGFNIGVSTITYFLPTLIDDLGFSDIDAEGMTVAPYVAGWFLVVFQAWHSDRTRDRGWHVVGSMLIAFTGYVILATSVQKSTGAGYFALFLVVGGNFSLFPLVMSWAANVFSPTSKRGVGTAFIVSISNCISIASPQIYFDPNDSYRKGHAICAGCLFASTLAALILRTRLAYRNKQNREKLEALTEDEKEELRDDDEIWDDDPRYVFMV